MAADKRESPTAPGQPAGSKPTAPTATDEAASLRRRAEDAIRSLEAEAGEEPKPGDARDLLHELSVHQVELEMQNDELRRTQEKLDATLARYLELYDFAPVGYLTLDEDGMILEANLTAMQLFGASAGELDSQPLSRFILREDQDVFYRHHHGVFAAQEQRESELRLVHNDGTPFWARLHSIAARPKKGEAPFCRTVISDITERRRSEREKEQSERRLRDAMDAACLISWEWEPADGRVIWAGRLDEGTAPGAGGVIDDPEAIRRLVLADDLGGLIKARDTARDGGTGFEHETRVEFPDGSTRWLSARGAFEYDRAGRPVRARGITQDVTARKLAETALGESETRYRELVENLNEMIYAIGLDSTITYVSPAVTTILGYQPGDLIGTTFTDIVHADDVEAIRDAFQSVLKGNLEPREYRLVDAKGELRWVRTSSRPLIKDGAAVGLRGVLADITESRRAQEALSSSERNFRETLENVHLIAVGLDAEGRINFINDFALQITGWSREDVLGRDWFDLMLPADGREEVREVFLSTIATGKLPPHYDNPIVTCDGHERIIHWSNTTQRDPAGRVVGVFSLGEDRTELVEAEEEILASLELQRYIVEHDPNAIAVYDRDLRYIAVSQRYLHDYGVEDADIIGKHHYEVFPEMPERWRAVHRRCLGGAVERNDDDFFERPDGSITYNRWECRPWYRPDHSIGGMITYTEVTTERKLAEISLLESEEKYRQLFTRMREGFALHELLCDDRGRPFDYKFLDANPAFFELTGLDSDILGRTVFEVLPETETFWIETYGRVVQSGTPEHFEHYSAQIGKFFDVRAFSPAPGRFATVFFDNTESKRAEVERKRLLSEIRGMAARLAEVEEAERKDLAGELHDRVGQNLTALGLNLSVVRNRLSPTELARVGSNLDDAAHLLVETTDQVRQVMTELRPPMLDGYGLVAALDWFAGVFSQRSGVTVKVSGSEPAPRLGSKTEMAIFRIVQEALTNVGKHAAAATVEISVEEEAGAVRVTVADDGRGFAAAPPASDRTEGWGLAIMKERAMSIGGALHIESEPQVGTRIVVELGARPA